MSIKPAKNRIEMQSLVQAGNLDNTRGITNKVEIEDAERRVQDVTILHTNDLHGHAETSIKDKQPARVGGLPVIASFIKKEKAEKPGALILDAGDILDGGAVSDYYNGAPLVESMNYLGYDAMTVGNHDVNTRKELQGIINKAEFPILSANLVDKRKKLDVKPYIFKRVGDLKIGILGLTTSKTMILNKEDKKNIEFISAADTARKNIKKMKKEGADIIVVLSHLGFKEDVKLAKTVDEINVIIGGHSHLKMDEPRLIGNTIITQAGAYGKQLGSLDFTVEHGGNEPSKIVHYKSRMISAAGKDVKPDEDVEKIVEKYASKLRKAMSRKIGSTTTGFQRDDYHIHSGESVFCNFLGDIVREDTDADVSIMNKSTLRADIPKGDITVGKIYNAIPFVNNISVVKLKGSHLKNVMEEFLNGHAYNFLISGLKVELDTSKPHGQKVKSIKMLDGKDFDLNKTYKIATLDFLADGNVGIHSFTKAQDRVDTDKEIRNVLLEHIEKHGEVSAKLDGRIIDHNKIGVVGTGLAKLESSKDFAMDFSQNIYQPQYASYEQYSG